MLDFKEDVLIMYKKLKSEGVSDDAAATLVVGFRLCNTLDEGFHSVIDFLDQLAIAIREKRP